MGQPCWAAEQVPQGQAAEQDTRQHKKCAYLTNPWPRMHPTCTPPKLLITDGTPALTLTPGTTKGPHVKAAQHSARATHSTHRALGARKRLLLFQSLLIINCLRIVPVLLILVILPLPVIPSCSLISDPFPSASRCPRNTARCQHRR